MKNDSNKTLQMKVIFKIYLKHKKYVKNILTLFGNYFRK